MEFDFSDFTNGKVAQQVEREGEDLRVTGSIPVLPTKEFLEWAMRWKEIDGGCVGDGPCIGIVTKEL